MDSCVWSCLGGKFTPASAGCGRLTRPKHVITTSIFQLPYGHNDPAIYADGVLRLAHAVGRILPEFTLRIFVDGSLVIPAAGVRPPSPRWLENMRKLANMSHVQLVYAACPGVFNKHTHGHYDLFGTMLRFIPMFEDRPDTPIWLQSPAEGGMALSFDSDMQEPYLSFYLRIFNEFSNVGQYDVFNITAPCMTIPWNEGPSKGIYTLLAGLFATRTRLPRSWFNEFIELAEAALKNPTDETNLIVAQAKRVREYSNGGFHLFRQIDQQLSPFTYGIDEIFLNYFLRPKLIAWSKPTKFIQIVMNMFLRGVDVVLKIIEHGGQLKSDDPRGRVEYNTSLNEIEGPFILSNPHIQRILSIASQAVLGEVLYGPIYDHSIAIELVKRITNELRRSTTHSWTLGQTYCNPTILPNEQYAERIKQMEPILGEIVAAEAEGALPPNPFYKYMHECWDGIKMYKPYTPVVHMLGNGESTKIDAPEAEHFVKRETLCPPRGPRRTFRRRERRNKTRKRLNKK